MRDTHRSIIHTLLALIFFVFSFAIAQAKQAPTDPYAAEFSALKKEYFHAMNPYYDALIAAKTDEDRKKVNMDPKLNVSPKFLPKFEALAIEAGRTDTAYNAWVTIFDMGPTIPDDDVSLAVNKIIRLFSSSPELNDFAKRLAFAFPDIVDMQARRRKVDGILRQVEQATKSDEVRAQVVYSRAKLASEADDPKTHFPYYYPDKPDALALYRLVVHRYPNTQAAKLSQIEIYEAEHLMVGKPAPEIEGIDQNGKRFKLSDYRGKVVLLDFWGLWCHSCMEEMPHHAKMQEQYKDQPFVIIGVDSDDGDRAAIQKRMVEKGISFRSFMDGKPVGPISKTWNVDGFPTLYVIDAKGIIRWKSVGRDPSELEAAVADAITTK